VIITALGSWEKLVPRCHLFTTPRTCYA
jgi:hypothetical protein